MKKLLFLLVCAALCLPGKMVGAERASSSAAPAPTEKAKQLKTKKQLEAMQKSVENALDEYTKTLTLKKDDLAGLKDALAKFYTFWDDNAHPFARFITAVGKFSDTAAAAALAKKMFDLQEQYENRIERLKKAARASSPVKLVRIPSLSPLEKESPHSSPTTFMPIVPESSSSASSATLPLSSATPPPSPAAAEETPSPSSSSGDAPATPYDV